MTELELALIRTGLGLLSAGVLWLIATVVRRGAEIAELRKDVEHLPDKSCTQRLALSVEKLSGEIERFAAQNRAERAGDRERLGIAERDIKRIERWLYEKGL